MPRTLCFDIETELFGGDFRRARDPAERQRLAPKPRVACAYDGRRWRDFQPGHEAKLVALLQAADVVVSFNGLTFDEPVLRRHYGLVGRLPREGRHVDLYAELVREGRGASLDRLAWANLGERKLVDGRAMAELDMPALIRACRSDVSQTWRLWRLWEKGQLKDAAIRSRPAAVRFDASDPHDVGPGHHAPEVCPACGDVGSLELVEMDTSDDEMSEGQASDYLAGLWGVSICRTCDTEIDWGF